MTALSVSVMRPDVTSPSERLATSETYWPWFFHLRLIGTADFLLDLRIGDEYRNAEKRMRL
jgi:hypothetical protein